MTRPLSGVHLTGWGAYAPSLLLTNVDLERMVDTNDEWIVSRTGIRERHIAGPTETTASMAAVAGLRAIATAGLQPDDIDLIIVGTLTPDFPMPSTAALVKGAIGNKHAAAMDLAAACSGFVFGYATAHAYIAAGLARHVLVIGAETLSRCTDFTDRSTCILFGDGAGAVVLSASDEPGGTLGIEMTTEPSGAYLIWLPAGGASRPTSDATMAGHEHFMKMKGPETYKMAVRTLGSTSLKSVEKAGLGLDDLELVIPHQANFRIIEGLAKSLNFPMERVFVNVGCYGNTSAASVPLALSEAVAAGRVKKGDHLLLVAFGAGLTSGAITLEWTADPANAARAAGIGPEDVTITPGYLEPVNPFPPALNWLLDRESAGGGAPTANSVNPAESGAPGVASQAE
jgi:3-oxoacyl-[acyl-carrier-protein] synthase-3